MKKIIITIFLIFFNTTTYSSVKENIIQNLAATHNFNFNFEQNINGKIENGNCIIEYPKKIYCKYKRNNKILVSNGKSLVVKTITSFYNYPLNKTPLDLILDKDFLIKKIYNLKETISDKTYISFAIKENDHEINVYFNKETLNLIGWQTVDIYQNVNFTHLSSVLVNQQIEIDLFKLPSQN